jgi:hypothetical protein
MWLNRLVVSGFLLAYAVPGQAPLTDQQVARAIDRAGKEADPYACVGRATVPDFRICLQGPEQRTVSVAIKAKELHRRLRAADVPADVRAYTWTIVVHPSQPALVNGRPVRSALAQDLTIQGAGHPELSVKPLTVAPLPVSWDNAIGVALKGQGLTATIDPSLLPPGDLEIVVVEDTGTARRYQLTESARAQVH